MKLSTKEQNQNNTPRPTTLKGVPFAWQDKRVTKVIRENFVGRKRSTAMALYQALTEMASNAGGKRGEAVSQFSVAHIKLADLIQKSISTIKRYTAEFRRLGIISWQTRKIHKENITSLYTLCAYSPHFTEPTSGHNNEPPTVVLSIELPIKERRKDSIIINKDVDNQENIREFKPLKDVLDKRNV